VPIRSLQLPTVAVVRDGALHFHEEIVRGIDRAPAALIGMMKGDAIGKMLVQVADA
jgi:NADPH-dependent curcumin reductase CurA